VKSYITQKFIDRYRKLPKEIREQARQAVFGKKTIITQASTSNESKIGRRLILYA
jgi:hypothetical protein